MARHGELAHPSYEEPVNPRIVAVHSPTGTGKSSVFPLAIARWTSSWATCNQAKATSGSGTLEYQSSCEYQSRASWWDTKYSPMLVNKRIPRCQSLILEGAMLKVRRIFVSQPIEKEQRLLFTMVQIISSRRSETAGAPLVNTSLNQLGHWTCGCKEIKRWGCENPKSPR